MRIQLDNGMTMLKCHPLRWRVEYEIFWDYNSEIYTITVGFMGYTCTLVEKTMILSIAAMSESETLIYRFKVESIEEASELVMKFVIGMGELESMEGTIFMRDY